MKQAIEMPAPNSNYIFYSDGAFKNMYFLNIWVIWTKRTLGFYIITKIK